MGPPSSTISSRDLFFIMNSMEFASSADGDTPFFALCDKCAYSECFWFAFSHIRLEYGEIRSQRFAVTITNPSSFVSMTASEYDGGKEDKKTRIQKTFHLWKLSLDIDWTHYLSWSIYHKFLWSLFSPDVHTNSSLISLTRSTKYFY